MASAISDSLNDGEDNANVTSAAAKPMNRLRFMYPLRRREFAVKVAQVSRPWQAFHKKSLADQRPFSSLIALTSCRRRRGLAAEAQIRHVPPCGPPPEFPYSRSWRCRAARLRRRDGHDQWVTPDVRAPLFRGRWRFGAAARAMPNRR